jgi:hypothetical protein
MVVARSPLKAREAQVLPVVPVSVARMHVHGLPVPITQLAGTATQLAVVVPPVRTTEQYCEFMVH